MKSFLPHLFSILVAGFSSSAVAQMYNESVEPVATVETTVPVDLLLHIDTTGVIREVATGTVRSAQDVENAIPAFGPIVVGVILGGGSAAIGAIYNRAGWGQVVAAGILGGVGGFYGGIATMTVGATRIMYGTYTVVYGGLGTAIVSTGPAAPGGNCGVVTDSYNCLLRPK